MIRLLCDNNSPEFRLNCGLTSCQRGRFLVSLVWPHSEERPSWLFLCSSQFGHRIFRRFCGQLAAFSNPATQCFTNFVANLPPFPIRPRSISPNSWPNSRLLQSGHTTYRIICGRITTVPISTTLLTKKIVAGSSKTRKEPQVPAQDLWLFSLNSIIGHTFGVAKVAIAQSRPHCAHPSS